jgi:hypothetical protein
MRGDRQIEQEIDPNEVDLLLSLFEVRQDGEECPESFLSIQAGEGYRVGVSVESKRAEIIYSIEVMLMLYRPGEETEPQALASRASFLSLLKDRGYSVIHLDHGWVCCTLTLSRSMIFREMEELIMILGSIIP